MRFVKAMCVAVAIVLPFSTSSAFAWSCLAVARDGAEGWSYHYGSKDQAIIRAIEECSKRGRDCRLVRCNPYG